MSKRRWGKTGALWSLGRTTAELAAGRRHWQALMTQAGGGQEAGKARRTSAKAADHAPGRAKPSRLREIRAFGPNPGRLRLFAHAPASLPKNAPLVVVLHGCTQSARDYDRGSGWSDLAERHGFAVLLPEQRKENNAQACFNWFDPAHSRRGAGEIASIREMIRHLRGERSIDSERIYVTGLSAGAAMAGALLASYPELFAGGALIAGIPFGAANSVPEAFQAMFTGRERPAGEWGEHVRDAAPAPDRWPSIAVWHGTQDRTVKPVNATETVKQWLDVHGLHGAKPEEILDGPLHRKVWRDGDGQTRVEEILVDGMDHGAPVTGELGQSSRFFPDHGVSSTALIAAAWGLAPAEQQTALVPVHDPAPRGRPEQPRDAEEVASPDEGDTMAQVSRTIHSALRAAGLMR